MVPEPEGADRRPRARGDVVVCIVGAGDGGAAVREIRIHTPALVEVLDRTAPADGGDLIADTADADLVLLDPRCRPGDGWLDALTAPGRDDAGVATASAIAVPADGPTPLAAPADVTAGAGPDLPAPSGPCVYLRRSALELVGAAGALDRAGRVSAAFAEGCRRAGLRHALAPLVVAAPAAWPVAGPVAEAVRRARDGLRIGIDARMLTGTPDGTRVHVLELIQALARAGGARLTVLTGARIDDPARARLLALDGVQVVTVGDGAPPPMQLKLDLVHRPFQLSAPPDLAVLGALAPRLVVTHQDLIAYRNPAYFASPQSWDRYRELTGEALAVADHVVFFSEHARRDALGEALVDQARASVVRIGVDHVRPAPAPPPASAMGAQPPAQGDVLLCLGADYRHKNRLFALRVVDSLQRDHGWDGWLVLAGPRIAHGSSHDDEQAFLAGRPSLRERVLDLGPVGDHDKQRLLERCALVLHPSVQEGFGLIPFEAAAHERACLWAAGSSLEELLPGLDGGIVPWSPQLTAQHVHALLHDPDARAASIAAVRRAGEALTWSETAERLLELYAAVCAATPSSLGAAMRRASVLGGVSDDGMRLVGPHGAVPTDLERPLLALFSRPGLARPIGVALRAGHAAARRRRGR